MWITNMVIVICIITYVNKLDEQNLENFEPGDNECRILS